MTQVAEAFVRLRPDVSGFGRDVQRQIRPAINQTERDLARTNREFSRFGRGALVGTGALSGLGRAAAFASTSFIGGAGLTYAIGSTVKAALESQRVLDQTKNAVEQGGSSWAQYGEQINRTITAQSELAAFDDEELLQTFQNLYRSTGNVTEALRLNALSANVARGRNIDLASAQQIVLKASIGQLGALRRLGLEIPKNATALQALDLIQRKYANSAETYGLTASGAFDRFKVSIENVQETIGEALLPALTDLTNQANKWLNNPENQERIRKTAEDTASAFGRAADHLGDAKDTIGAIFRLDFNHPPRWLEDMDRDFQNKVDDWKRRINLLPGVPLFRAGPGTLDRAGGGGDFPAALRPDNRGGPFGPGASTPIGGSIPGSVSGTAGRVLPGNVSTGIPWLDNLLAAAEATSGRGDDERVIRRAITVLRGRLNNATSLGARTDLQQAINAFADRLSGLEEQDAQVIQDAIDRRKEQAQNRADKIKAGRQAGRDALADLAASLQEQAQQAADRRARLIDSLTGVPEGLALEEQIAAQRSTKEEKLLPFLRREAKAVGGQIRELKFLHASKDEVLRATLTLATINRRIRDINSKDAADSGSRTDIFEQAAREFELYGSNIGPRAPLSGQDARGAVAGNILGNAGKSVTVIQNFLRGEHSVGQALQQAHQAASALR